MKIQPRTTTLLPWEAYESLHSVRVIDVREPDEFDGPMGHIRGAELHPLLALEDTTACFAGNAPLLVVSRSGHRSRVAAARLEALGLSRVSTLAGGMLAWRRAGLPVHRGQAIEEVRDQLLEWVARASSLSTAHVLPAFRWLFEARGASFEEPTSEGIAAVLGTVQAMALLGGSSPPQLEADLREFRSALDGF